MRNTKPNTTGVIAIIAVVLACAYGWIANIVKTIAMAGDHSVTTEFVLRIVGIFAAPLGAVMGYL